GAQAFGDRQAEGLRCATVDQSIRARESHSKRCLIAAPGNADVIDLGREPLHEAAQGTITDNEKTNGLMAAEPRGRVDEEANALFRMMATDGDQQAATFVLHAARGEHLPPYTLIALGWGEFRLLDPEWHDMAVRNAVTAEPLRQPMTGNDSGIKSCA